MSSKSEDVRPRAALCASAAQSSVDKWWFTQKRWFIRKDNKDETSELQIQHRLKKRASSECVHSSFVESSINLVPLLILQQNPPTLTFGPGQRRGIFRFMFYVLCFTMWSRRKVHKTKRTRYLPFEWWLRVRFALDWWRIAGSNRWPLACHASALPNHALTHPHAKVREWTIFSVRTFYFEKGTFSPKSNSVA